MATYQLGKQIEILNNIPWIKGMVVNEIIELTEDATKFEGRLVYVRNAPEKYYFVDAAGNAIPVSQLIIQTVDNIEALKNSIIRKQGALLIVRNYDEANESIPVSADPNTKLLQYKNESILDADWQNLSNWLNLSGGSSDSAGFSNEILVDPNIESSQLAIKLFKTPAEAIAVATSGNKIIFGPGVYEITDVNTSWVKDGITYDFSDGAIVDFKVACNLFDYSNSVDGNINIIGKPTFIYSGPSMTFADHTEFYPININGVIDKINIEIKNLKVPFGINVGGVCNDCNVDIDEVTLDKFFGNSGIKFGVTSDSELANINCNITHVNIIARTEDNGSNELNMVSAIDISNLSSDVLNCQAFININIGIIYLYDNSQGEGFGLVRLSNSDKRLDSLPKYNIKVGTINATRINSKQTAHALYIDNNCGELTIDIDTMNLFGFIEPIYYNDSVNSYMDCNIHIKNLNSERGIGEITLLNNSNINLTVDNGLMSGLVPSETLRVNGDKTKINSLTLKGDYFNETQTSGTTPKGLDIISAIRKIYFSNCTLIAKNANNCISGVEQEIEIQNFFAFDKQMGHNVKNVSYGLEIPLYPGLYYFDSFVNTDLIDGKYTINHNLENKYVDIYIYDGSGDYVDPNGILTTSDTNNLELNIGSINDEWKLVVYYPLREIINNPERSGGNIIEITNDDLVDGKYILSKYSTLMKYPLVVIYDSYGEYQSLVGIYKVNSETELEFNFGNIDGTYYLLGYGFKTVFELELTENSPEFDNGKLTINHGKKTLTPQVMLFNGDDEYESLNGLLHVENENTIDIYLAPFMLGDKTWKLIVV